MIRRLLRAALVLVSILLVVLVGVFASLRTETVQQRLPGWIEQVSRVPGVFGMQLGTVEGKLPGQLRVTGLVLEDGDGPWLSIDEAELRWHPGALLRGRIDIAHLRGGIVRWMRLPKASEERTPYEWPEEMSWFRLGELRIASLHIEEKVLGREAELRAEGNALLGAGERDRLHLRIDDGKDGGDSLVLELLAGEQPGNRRVELKLVAPAGAAVAQWAKLGPTGTIHAELEGDGPLSDWQGTLSAKARRESGDATLDADIALQAAGDAVVDATLNTRLAAAEFLGNADPALRAILEAVELDVDLRFARDPADAPAGTEALATATEPRFWVHGGELRSAGLHVDLSVEGPMDGSSVAVDARLQDIPADAPGISAVLKRVLGDLSVAGLGVRVESGPPTGPMGGASASSVAVPDEVPVNVEVEVARLRVGEVATGASTLGLKGLSAPDGFRGKVTANLQEIRAGAADAPVVVPAVTASAGISVASGATEVTKVLVDASGLRVSGQVTVGDAASATAKSAVVTGAFSVSAVDLRKPLAILPATAGKPNPLAENIRGSVDLRVGLKGNPEASWWSVRVDGNVGKPAWRPVPELASLLGLRVPLGVTVRVDPAGTSLSDLRVAADFATVEGGVRLKPDGALAPSALQITASDLAPLSALLKTKVDGVLNAEITASGPTANLKTKLNAAIAGLEVAGQRFDRVELETALAIAQTSTAAGKKGTGSKSAGAVTVQGPVGLTSTWGGAVASAKANLLVAGDGAVVLDQLQVLAPGTDLRGDVSVSPAGAVRASALGRIEDLSVWTEPLGPIVRGGGSVDVVWDDGALRADADLVGLKIPGSDAGAADALAIAEARVHADLTLTDGKPGGSANVEIRGLGAGSLSAEKIDVRSRATDGHWSITATASGEEPAAFTVQSDVRVEPLAGGMHAILLDSLDAVFAQVPVKSSDTGRIRIGSGGGSIDALSLKLGETGSADVAGTWSSSLLDLRADVQRLPLALAALADPILQWEGEADVRVTFTGPPARAAMDAGFDIRGWRGKDPASAGLTPLAGSGKVRLLNGSMDTSVAISGFSNTQVYVDLATRPLAGTSAASLEGRLRCAGQIEELRLLAPVGEDRVRGYLDSDLLITGNTTSPVLDGTVQMREGFFESISTGAVLADIEAELIATSDRFHLRTFRATDGSEGKIEADGEVRLNGPQLDGFDFRGGLRRAKVMRLDDISAETDADVRVVGISTVEDGLSVQVGADIRPRLVHVDLSARMGSSVPHLDVVEVSGAGNDPEADEPEPEPLVPVTLDFRIKATDRLYVTGRGMDTEWKADLRVTGPATSPLVRGKVKSVRGHADLFGRRFAISDGLLDFHGAANNIPQMNVEARADAEEIEAVVRVYGPASDPKFELSSEPALPQDEVLARVLFGEDASALTPMQSLRLAQSLATLSGKGLGEGISMLDKMGRTLGFDRVGVGGGSGGSTVSMGKYLTEGVYLNVEQGLTPESSKLSVEVELTDNLTLQSDVGRDATGEIGLDWRYDY